MEQEFHLAESDLITLNLRRLISDHYKSNRPALLLIGNQTGMQHFILLISGAGGGAGAGGAGGEQELDEVDEVQ